MRAGHASELSGDAAEAERLYGRAIAHDPQYAEAYYFLGRMAERDERREEAIVHFQKAADLEPREVIYQFALGNALLSLRYFEEAAAAFAAGCALQPEYAEVQINHAAALIEMNRREEVRISLEQLRERRPDIWQVHFNLGGIYREYGRIGEAVECYRRCLELMPDHPASRSNLLLIMNYGAGYTAREIFEQHKRFGEQFDRPYVVPQPDRTWPRKLRIGYVSPDFRGHVVTYFIEPLLANHDREAFEIFCYHSHPEKDGTTDRLRGYADHWRDCETWSDAELDRRIREDRIDILVDLAGHTAESRLLAFATKPAPVQATYLGYPNSSGLSAIDYHITDAFADPPESDALSIERKARVPDTYFCYRPAPRTPEPGRYPARGPGTVSFGCFNNFAKISPAFITAAARVLKAVPGSRLLLKARPLSVASVVEGLRASFERLGVGPEQLDLRGWESGYRDHLRIYHEVDIALDSFPYNGATTTCEALWMGVPVVTLQGDRHAARMGSSLLHAMGLEDLIATDVDDYVKRSVALAADPSRIQALRQDLRGRMERSPLRDEVRFARKLEALYLSMWERALEAAPSPTVMAPDERPLERARRYMQEGRLADADASIRTLLSSRPDHAEAVRLLCEISFAASAPGGAIEPLRRALAADGSNASFHYLLGSVLQELGRLDDAVSSLSRALELDPQLAKAHNNLGCVLETAGRLDQAIVRFEEAVRLDPSVPEAHYNLGNAYRQIGQIDKAMASLERAVALQPENAEWRSNLSELQYGRWKFDEAIASLRIAISSDPKHRLSHMNLGAALLMTGAVEDACSAVRAAEAIKEESSSAEWLLFAAHYRDYEPRSMFEAHVAWGQRYASGLPRVTQHAARRRSRGGRLNIGYVSPDFRTHPVARFIEPVLECHDHQRFRVFAYAIAPGGDRTTERIKSACDYWRDAWPLSDEAIADLIRADGIDILIDMAGHTAGGRPLIFARKPAPIQATWIGYPNTTGLAAMDYRLTDAIADPIGQSDPHYVEKLVRLGNGFLCYRPPDDAPEVVEPPVVSAGRVTFGSFNTLPKVTMEMAALWSQILAALPGSRLVVKSFGLAAASARARLGQFFAARGIDRDRLTLLPPEDTVVGHLARYADVDIALDTFPYNGTTTTCEALWMGVPVITLAGNTHVSRVGASLLGSAGLSELVAEVPQDYVARCLRLAEDTERLRSLRSAMRGRLRASRLLDGVACTRTLENEYVRMAAAAGLGAVRATSSGG